MKYDKSKLITLIVCIAIMGVFIFICRQVKAEEIPEWVKEKVPLRYDAKFTMGPSIPKDCRYIGVETNRCENCMDRMWFACPQETWKLYMKILENQDRIIELLEEKNPLVGGCHEIYFKDGLCICELGSLKYVINCDKSFNMDHVDMMTPEEWAESYNSSPYSKPSRHYVYGKNPYIKPYELKGIDRLPDKGIYYDWDADLWKVILKKEKRLTPGKDE